MGNRLELLGHRTHMRKDEGYNNCCDRGHLIKLTEEIMHAERSFWVEYKMDWIKDSLARTAGAFRGVRRSVLSVKNFNIRFNMFLFVVHLFQLLQTAFSDNVSISLLRRSSLLIYKCY